MRIPARYSNLLFGAILSAIMVTVASGAVVLVTEGLGPEFPAHWFNGFVTAWPIAFPTVLVVAPWVRKIVARITALPNEGAGRSCGD